MTRKASAFALVWLICAQGAIGSPLANKFLKELDCKGVCKRRASPAVLGKSKIGCLPGYTLEQDKLGLNQCAKHTPQECPKGTFLNDSTGKCCPPESLCFPSLAGVCPPGTVVKTTCGDKRAKIGSGLPARLVTNEVVTGEELNQVAFGPNKVAQAAKALPVGATAETGTDSQNHSRSGRQLKTTIGGLAASAINPAVTVNAEVFRPVVVLPKPPVSFNVPPYANIRYPEDPLWMPRPRPPIVVLPRPPVEFIPPNIAIEAPEMHIPQRDRLVPVLPTPPVSFYPPLLNGQAGGLNLARKYAVIDASRLGSQTAVEVNMPPIDVPIINPVQVNIKPPGQQIIDLSQFGAEDTTVVQLPNYQVKLPSPIKVIPEPGHVHVVNLAAAQTGPVYEIQLPGLPQSNNIDISLPKVNFTGVTLPGNRNKDLVIVNVQPPNMPPDHTIQIDIDESRAALNNLPLPVKVNGLLPNTTNVNMVNLPPVTLPDFGDIVTVDARINSTAPDIRFQLPDTEVVRVTLPDPPVIGRDISVKLPDIPLNRFVPAGIIPGDDGGLNLTTTIVDATLPSLNVVPALTKPFIKPGNFTISTRGSGAGKGQWGVNVQAHDELYGSAPLAPIQIGGPLPSDSLFAVLREAAVAQLDADSGEYCNNACCPACKDRPVKIEYSPLVVDCPAGCTTSIGGQCVCKPATLSSCSPEQMACEVESGKSGLCMRPTLHPDHCRPLFAFCTAQKNLEDCPAS